MCQMCKTTPKNWRGSDRRCAFLNGRFSSNNWNCETASILRAIAQKSGVKVSFDDTYVAMCRTAQGVLIVSWYKNRGRTSQIRLIRSDNSAPRNITIKQAELIINEDWARAIV